MKLPQNNTIYLANFSVDMRKSIDGLSLLVYNYFDKNPADGSIYVFSNRACNKIKILYFERNGFVLWYKRLEKGRFKLRHREDGLLRIDGAQLQWLLDGLDFLNLRGHPTLRYDTFC